MVSIETAALKRQAGLLYREAQKLNDRILELEKSIVWSGRQETEGAERICRNLKKQHEMLMIQRRERTVLSETLQSICGSYRRTEQKILDASEYRPGRGGCIASVNLKGIQERLRELGLLHGAD